MTREERADKAFLKLMENQKGIIHIVDAWLGGARWADKHPRKGLVEIDKACEWLDGAIWDYIDLSNIPVNSYIDIDGNKFLQDFRKAMLEEE